MHDPNIFSDHCLIGFSLNAKEKQQNAKHADDNINIEKVYKWDQNKYTKYFHQIIKKNRNRTTDKHA